MVLQLSLSSTMVHQLILSTVVLLSTIVLILSTMVLQFQCSISIVTTIDLSLDFMDLHLLSLGSSLHSSNLVVTFMRTHKWSITTIPSSNLDIISRMQSSISILILDIITERLCDYHVNLMLSIRIMFCGMCLVFSLG